MIDKKGAFSTVDLLIHREQVLNRQTMWLKVH